MRGLTVILYRGEDADLTLPIRLLKEEQIRWVVEDNVTKMRQLGGLDIDAERGWYAYFPAFRQGASRWTEIYKILDTHGLLS